MCPILVPRVVVLSPMVEMEFFLRPVPTPGREHYCDCVGRFILYYFYKLAAFMLTSDSSDGLFEYTALALVRPAVPPNWRFLIRLPPELS